MTRLILLDAGPLGLVTNPRESDETRRCKEWLRSLLVADVRVMVPAITDYEVRRELLRVGRPKGIGRLNDLTEQLGVLSITDQVLLRAADLWAKARRGGYPTADDKALDADVILAATANLASDDGFAVTIATTNIVHLGRFADAQLWSEIPTTTIVTAEGQHTPRLESPTDDAGEAGDSTIEGK